MRSATDAEILNLYAKVTGDQPDTDQTRNASIVSDVRQVLEAQSLAEAANVIAWWGIHLDHRTIAKRLRQSAKLHGE